MSALEALMPRLNSAGAEDGGNQRWPWKWRSHGQCWRPRWTDS